MSIEGGRPHQRPETGPLATYGDPFRSNRGKVAKRVLNRLPPLRSATFTSLLPEIQWERAVATSSTSSTIDLVGMQTGLILLAPPPVSVAQRIRQGDFL